VTCEVPLPWATALPWLVSSSSQMAGPSGWGRGIARRDCQSSLKARATADSVSSRPSFSRRVAAVIGPVCSSTFQSSTTSGEALWMADEPGACFQSRSPRRETRKGNTSPWARKSGCSPGAPRRLSPITKSDRTSLDSKPFACSIAACGGSPLACPRQASTNEGAGAGNWARRGR
jgi:hypothetical protein